MSIKRLVVLGAVFSMAACSTWGPTSLCSYDDQTQDQFCAAESQTPLDFGSQPVIIANDE